MPLTQEQIAEITGVVKTAMTEAQNGATVEERKEIFEGETKGLEHNKPEGKAKIGAFLKALVTNDDATLKDLSTGVDADGGYLTPTEFHSALVEKEFVIPGIQNLATVLPMTSDKLEVPVEANGVTVYWPGENTAITQSDPTFGNVTLVANIVAGLSRMSRQLVQDAATNPQIVDFVMTRFAEAIGREKDKQYMTGNGTGKPKGIRTYTISQAVAQAAGSLAGDDIINLYYTLPRQYRDNATWVLHDSVIKLVRKLKDSSGHYLWAENWTQGTLAQNQMPTLMGRPVLIQNDIPTNLGAGTNESEVFFGDLSKYLVGRREETFMETSTQEGNAFAKHQVAVKVGERVDGQLSLTEAFAKLTAVK